MPETNTESVFNAHNKEEHAPSHTAEHIINRTMDNKFHCGRSVEAHIERKKSKMDFALPVCPSAQEMHEVEQTVNEVIARGLEVTAVVMSQADAAGRFDLGRLPEGASDLVRMVSVGDYDDCLCLGRHVANTSMIGEVKFASFDYNEEKHILRLRFKVIEPVR